MLTSEKLNTSLAGRYVIEREIGRGGMATVYLARDIRHERNVALKVLNPDLGAVLGVERFLAEIRVTANLQHPNLLPLFDSGEVDGLLFYVMPFVEGESLRVRLEREKQFPVDEAVRIAVAVANALDYAHGHGVIHRDLKPENILLQHGQPVVADFGIALAVSKAGGARITQTGLSLGTPQYMSPEQATGDRVIDGRADIYSLGAVLYEMLAGEPPHSGTTAQAIIAKLMTEEPRPLTVLRRSAPPDVDAAVHRALEKLPADRWATVREFSDVLSGARPYERTAPRPVVTSLSQRRAVPWVIAGVASLIALVAVAAAIAVTRRAPVAADVTLRFPFVTADSERFIPTTPAIPFSISPDDQRVAYVGVGPNYGRVYVKSFADLQTRVLPNTERPLQPTFSPDGRWIALVTDDRLVRVPVEGGPATTVLQLNGQANAGMSWVDPDTIIASIGGALAAVPVNGGTPVVLSRPDTSRGETLQWGPRVVNARFVVYISVGTVGMASNRLGVLDRRTGRAAVTTIHGTTVLGTVDDRVLWVTTTGSGMAARIDKSGTLDTPQRVLEDVLVRFGGAAKAVLSRRGSLLYQRGVSLSQLVLVDEHGAGVPLGTEPHAYWHPRWSPDGSRIAVAIARTGGSDLWLIDVRTKTMSKLTTAEGIDDQAEWTPDGKRIIYRSVTPSGTVLKWIPIDGSERPTILRSSPADLLSGALSHDGKMLVLRTGDLGVRFRDIFVAPTTGDTTPRPIVATAASEITPVLSPDDRWMAYTSDDGGRPEVYVRPFPGPGQRIQISSAGATEPRWSNDGHTVFYRVGRTVMAASLSTTPSVAVTATRKLFDGAYLTDGGHANYDFSPDGKHFLMLQAVDRQAETIMVYGWANELRKAWK
jgi:serine/threonine protein kinase/Tol biopolymer transport system component